MQERRGRVQGAMWLKQQALYALPLLHSLFIRKHLLVKQTTSVPGLIQQQKFLKMLFKPILARAPDPVHGPKGSLISYAATHYHKHNLSCFEPLWIRVPRCGLRTPNCPPPFSRLLTLFAKTSCTTCTTTLSPVLITTRIFSIAHRLYFVCCNYCGWAEMYASSCRAYVIAC